MKSSKTDLLRAKLKAAKAEQRMWLKTYNRAERALLRLYVHIQELEKKLGNELAKPE